MDTIFILTTHPHNLYIAVRTGQQGYYGAYNILSTEYGWSDCDKITESNQFKEIEIRDLPEELRSSYEFEKMVASGNIDKILIHENS